MLAYVRAMPFLWDDHRAVTALEYAIIAGVIVATIAVGFNVFAGDLRTSSTRSPPACEPA